MIKFCFSILFTCCGIVASAQQPSYTWKCTAPDGTKEMCMKLSGGELSYTISCHGQVLVMPSALGVETSTASYSKGIALVKSTKSRIDERYTLRIGKQKNNHARANEIVTQFTNATGAIFSVEIRVYNEGIAFRYVFDNIKAPDTLRTEHTTFSVSTKAKMWAQPYGKPTQWGPAYEQMFENDIAPGQLPKDSSGWAFPLLLHMGNSWCMITESNLTPDYCGTHIAPNSDEGVFKIAFPFAAEAEGIGEAQPVIHKGAATPWRVVMLGTSLGDIIESNLVYHVAAANTIGDDSWVKPGRSSWGWWSDHESGKNATTLLRFVALAATMGWEYSMIDANWNTIPNDDMQHLFKYAQQKKVGLSLWYNSGGPNNVVAEEPRDLMYDPVKRKATFKKLARAGVKMVKIDFFNSDKQNIIQQYFDILKDAAAAKIMVVFHGCTLPRGWSRTYPNLVSMEAVLGAESYGWSPAYAQQAPMANTILATVRNVVGPMDYTPVTFSNYACCKHITTHAHELALSVLFESGITHFADKDSAYLALSAAVKKFLRYVPVHWDETQYLSGYPGKDIVLARRSGATWYIAGINGEKEPKAFDVALPVTGNKKYTAHIFSDGANSETIHHRVSAVQTAEKIKIHTLPYGGFTLVLTPSK